MNKIELYGLEEDKVITNMHKLSTRQNYKLEKNKVLSILR